MIQSYCHFNWVVNNSTRGNQDMLLKELRSIIGSEGKGGGEKEWRWARSMFTRLVRLEGGLFGAYELFGK